MTEPLKATSFEKQRRPFDVRTVLAHSGVYSAVITLGFSHITEAPMVETF